MNTATTEPFGAMGSAFSLASDDLDLVHRICDTVRAQPGDLRDIVIAEVERVAPLRSRSERTQLVSRVIARLDGLDVLDDYLADPLVDEVMINDGREVFIERAGTIERVAVLDDGTADVILERVVAPIGRRVDRTRPIVDARLPSGARLCAVVPPVAVGGTCLSIRRHRPQRFDLDSFADPAVAALLADLVGARANVLVTGATSSGKTSLLAALLAMADRGDRIIVIEDTAELPVEINPGRPADYPGNHPSEGAEAGHHLVRLEARPSTTDTVQHIALDDLVIAAMRLRPDRLVVGEFRGTEVLAVVQALNTGHDGSLSTCHANSATDGLARVETLLMQAAPSWPLPAIRDQIGRSIDAVVHVARSADGCRRVVEVGEVIPARQPGDRLSIRHLSDGINVRSTFERRRR